VTHYYQDYAGLAKEMKQKGVVLIVNGKPAILYPEASLVNEARRILTSKIGLEDNLILGFLDSKSSCRVWAWRAKSSTTGHSHDSVSLILDEGMTFTVDLSDRAWGTDPIRQSQWVDRERALNMEILP
jgi:hypothetical protein